MMIHALAVWTALFTGSGFSEAGCANCHPQVAADYARSPMASAATGPEFQAEWAAAGFDPGCRDCHAPRGGGGVGCRACHRGAVHQALTPQVPGVCATCHDAPGESTLRSHARSPAARAQVGCTDCHAGGTTGHRFDGPATPGFLAGAATLRAVWTGAPQPALQVEIRHRAGHALPGGSTGRAVWLLAEGLDREGEKTWQARRRFGWWRHPDGTLREATLPPGRATWTRFQPLGRKDTVAIRLSLVFRFRAGPLERPDPWAVLLDQLELPLPAGHRQPQPPSMPWRSRSRASSGGTGLEK